jgi:hypothetical protein
MSINLTILQIAPATVDFERAHRLRLRVAYWTASLATFTVFMYGLDYYLSGAKQRALSPKHALLKPGGTIGLTFGIVGFFLFLIVYLYPIRQRWAWLGRQGSSRHWLDFHILLGFVAPLFITFHSSLKFRGIAGVAYWIMILVALSGLVGRYLYSQIPRTLNYTAMTLKDSHQQIDELASQIKSLGVLSAKDAVGLFNLPDLRQAEGMSLMSALCKMLAFDLAFQFRMWRIKQRTVWRCSLMNFGRSPNVPLKRTISLVREQALLSKKVFFLSKSQQMLRLWHVIHRPFSYSFAILALFHVIMMVVFGYY